MEKSTKFKEFIRAIKFTLVSISAGLIQVGSFSLLFYVFSVPEWLSNAISLVLSVIWNFTINRKITFKSANNVKIAMLLVALFYVVFVPLSSLFHEFAASVNLEAIIAEVIVLIANFVLEYLYTRFIVYRNSCDTAEVKKSVNNETETQEVDDSSKNN